MAQMRDCADYEYRKADARLSRVYKKALQFMNDDLRRAQKQEDQDQVRYEQAGVKGLQEAQRAWLSYRDLQCKEADQRYETGTMAPIAFSNCLTTLTDHRIDDLKSVYEDANDKLE